ncbi:MAG TPA: amino acid adenylation domain-containing protein, partial [Thermoanaerobaculia bacterium]|nr:amino acid adenylation domain-containing protein [Thermoanaerobaculia bacterium]
LAPAELQQQLHEWNDTAAPYPRDLCLHQPFEARAAAAPDAPALFFGGERWSYGELNRRANQLAHRLVSLGVGPGRLVAVYLERGCEMVAAVLAVHKAGGAYVPLEGSWPLERIHWILANKGIAHVVTQAGRLGVVQALPPLPALAHVVCVDRLGGEATAGAGAAALWSLADIERLPATDHKLRSGADDLAYIIFTSGSTGKPKGVMVRHQPAVNLVHWVNHRFRVGPADRLLFITALSFDLSVYDLFGMLAAGGSVRIAATSEVRDPEALVGILRREPITFWDSAPAALQQLVSYFPAAGSAAPADREGALRLVFLSGDWIPLSLPDRVREAFPRARVVSLGGATEATIWSNFFPVGTVDPSWASIPYGRPIENARYHILDGHLNPSPIGVPGDLYIGGECLSSGYVNEPEMTAEKYIPDLLGGEPGARLYRTGDRARYWPDGTMEFLGRVDTQVKVRGFRIELGEIESVLGSHPSVREAVVLAREDTPGDQRLVAYVIPQGGEAPPIAPLDLRRFVQTKLPDYMVPAAFVTRESWPLSPTGKLDRKALPAPDAPASTLASGAAVVAEFAPPQTALERTIAGIWREVIGIEAVGTRENFFDLGGHSLLMARVHAKLQEALDRKLSLVDLFQFPTVASLAEHLGGGQAPAAAARAPSARTRIERAGSEIAVVGLAGRFPGARDVEEYWRNLRDGVESIRFFSDEELLAAAFPQELLSDPRLVKARGVLDGADLFDAAFFDYSPREAQIMDPQQRIFLECAWEALENAGYSPERYGGRIGVYGGVTENTYLWNLYSRPELIAAVGRHQISIANNHDFLPTRVSYKLNLRGPSINVQTACSTSLVAVHLACESLLLGDCDMALAGGVSVQAREIGGYLYAEGGIASPDGHTRAFDARARGVVSGSGVGLVVLKRLEDALADGDTVHAVIRGTASNNDGGRKVGFTAPSALGQAAAVRAALEQAGVEPKTVRYVEAHGTGTELGDPIEIAGLTQAFDTPERGFCAIGSAKTNIGHLDAAAGVAGLIKTVLALEHRQIPPSLHFEAPNPNIDFTASPFYVNARLADWPADGTPRRAGVSSFGIGGTNAHAVLEEAPAAAPSGPSRPAQLLLLSAKTAAALDRAAANLAAHLESHPEIDLADAAYTLQVGRNGLRHRRMLVAAGCEDAVAALRSHPSDGPEKRERSATAVHEPGERPIAFLFPGQGSQYAGMGAEIYVGEPIFRAALDECALLLQPELGLDLRAILYPDPDDAAAGERAAHELGQTGLTQPALFAVEYALARLWMSWGIRPRAMIGHSIGEYVAACLAGVFPLADALRLVAARGRLMQALPPGAMLGVGLAEAAVRCELNAEVDIELAAVNGPRSSVVSGTVEAVSALEERLQARGVECRRLHTSHAFHSAGMDPILPVFRERVASVDLRPPEIPFLSNVTGTWITAAEATDPGYWARHLRQPVRFADGLSELLGQPAPILLEVGPGRTLSVLARQHPGKGKAAAITSLPHARERRSDLQSVLGALGRLWLAGAEVDWAGLYAGERRRRVPLPTYPFERKRFWIDAAPRAGAVAETGRVPETPAEAEPAGGAAVDEGRAGYLAPRNEVEEGVARLVGEMLGIPRVGIHDDVFELGGSSLMAVQLGSRLRQRFAVELSSNFLLEASTVAALAELIQARQGPAGAAAGPRPSCLVRLQAGSAASRPLFMVHQVGGNVYTFRALGRELGRDQTLYGLRSLGLEEGEEPLASVEEMAALYLSRVREAQPRGPYRIGGASMGGMIAFEMAHQLHAAGEEVALLTLMDTPCLDQMGPQPMEDGEFVAAVFLGRVALTPEELRPLDLEAQLAYALDKAARSGAGDGFGLEEARRLVAVLRGNVNALYDYPPRPYPGRLLFFRALTRRPIDPPRPELPWIELAQGGLEIVLVPGDHQTMHEPPHVRALADRLKVLL